MSYSSIITVALPYSGVITQTVRESRDLALLAGCEYPNADFTNKDETTVLLFDQEAETFLREKAAPHMSYGQLTLTGCTLLLASIDKKELPAEYLRVSVTLEG